MNQLPHYEPDQLTDNPFIKSLIIEVTKITDSKTFTPSKDGVMLPKVSYTDRQTNTKIIHSAGFLDAWCNLSDRAQRLCGWIERTLQPSQDYIVINRNRYMSMNNIKNVKTYRAALHELKRYEYIDFTQYTDVFYINPKIFFVGNRTLNFPKNVVIKGKWTK